MTRNPLRLAFAGLLALTLAACSPSLQGGVQTGLQVAGSLAGTLDPARLYAETTAGVTSVVFDNTSASITLPADRVTVFLYGQAGADTTPFKVITYTDATDATKPIYYGCTLTTVGVVTAPNGVRCHTSFDGIGVELNTVDRLTRYRLGILGTVVSGNAVLFRGSAPRYANLSGVK
jgi:hypothetical protein